MTKKAIVSFTERVKISFDSFPTEIKIIFYGGLNAFFAILASDIEALQNNWWARYVAIFVGVGANLAAWLLLQEKNPAKEVKE